jgi:TRAP-type C4-dicarboxylate transport system permease small subunit
VEKYRTFASSLNTWVSRAAIGLLSILVLVVLMAVFFRYVLGNSLPWSEEVGRYLSVWVGFLGASVALSKRIHIGVDYVVDRLPKNQRRLLKLISEFTILILLGVISYYGIELVIFQIPQQTSALLISMFWPYLSVPVGTLLMMIQCVSLLIEDWKN